MSNIVRATTSFGSLPGSSGTATIRTCALSIGTCARVILAVFLSDFILIGTYSTFVASYLVFAHGKFPGMKIDRPGMAIIGAVLMFAFGALRPSDALHFVDLGTVVLLFSMMLLVAYLHVAGFFECCSPMSKDHGGSVDEKAAYNRKQLQ